MKVKKKIIFFLRGGIFGNVGFRKDGVVSGFLCLIYGRIYEILDEYFWRGWLNVFCLLWIAMFWKRFGEKRVLYS